MGFPEREGVEFEDELLTVEKNAVTVVLTATTAKLVARVIGAARETDIIGPLADALAALDESADRAEGMG